MPTASANLPQASADRVCGHRIGGGIAFDRIPHSDRLIAAVLMSRAVLSR